MNRNSMNYFRYLFSDKKGKPYWFLYYIALLIFVAIQFSVNWKAINSENITISFDILSFFNLLINFAVFFAFPLFYSYSFYNYRKQQRFLTKYSSLINDNSIREVSVLIIQGNYQMTTLKSNRFVTINPTPKIDTFTIAEIGDNLVILGQCYTFGVFREHLRPVLINLGKNKIYVNYEYAKIAQDFKFSVIENDLEIDFTKPVFDIKKIKIKDWKK